MHTARQCAEALRWQSARGRSSKPVEVAPYMNPAEREPCTSPRRANHAPTFNACNTVAIVAAGAPGLIRTVTPSIVTSIVPETDSSRRCARVLGCRGVTAPHGAASTTAGTNRRSSPDAAASASQTRRRHPNNCWVTIHAGAPRSKRSCPGFRSRRLSAPFPRRSTPPATCTVQHFQPANRLGDSTINCIHSKPNGSRGPKGRRSRHLPKGEVGTTLTLNTHRG